jgi:ribonuclease T1
MPIRDRIIWGLHNPFGDPRLDQLDDLIRDIIRYGRRPHCTKGGKVFENRDADLPVKPYGYYREYDVTQPQSTGRGVLRIVLGGRGEVYISGNHYGTFRRVINMRVT